MIYSESKNPLRILLIDDRASEVSPLGEALDAAGFDLQSVNCSTPALLHQIEFHRPDVVVVESEFPGKVLLDCLTVVNDLKPVPLVMITREDDPVFIRRAIQAGVTTYLMKDTNLANLKAIIDATLVQFELFQAVCLQLKKSREQLEDQKLISRARSLLMQQQNVNENDAHQFLTRMAMDNNLKLREVAQTIITNLNQSQVKF